MVTLAGVGIVFVVLIILAAVILCFKYVFAQKHDDKAVKPQARPAQAKSAADAGREDAEYMIDEELVAAIAAAIAATDPGKRFVVKSIVRVPDSFPVWGSAARQGQINRMTGR